MKIYSSDGFGFQIGQLNDEEWDSVIVEEIRVGSEFTQIETIFVDGILSAIQFTCEMNSN